MLIIRQSNASSYCTKIEQRCPGYKDHFDLVWRDQTEVAQKSVQRRRAYDRQVALDSLSETSPVLSTRANSCLLERDVYQPEKEYSLQIPSILYGNPQTYALDFFFSTYAKPPIRAEERLLELFHNIATQYSQTGSQSTLRNSTLAVSTLLLTAWLNRSADNPVSRLFYLQAVQTMKDQIRRQEGCDGDEMLTSVLLLPMHENLLVTTRKGPPSRAHLDGAMALIKLRGINNFTNKTSQGILFHVRSQLIHVALQNYQPLPDDIKSWCDVLKVAESQLAPSTRLENISVDLAHLQAHGKSRVHLLLHTNSNPCLPEPTKIIYKARNIEKRLEQWSATLPEAWYPVFIEGEECIPTKIREAGLYQPHCHIYPSISIAAIWNNYRLSFLRTQLIILAQLITLDPSVVNLTSIAACRNKMQLLVDDVCASIPSHFRRIGLDR